MSEVQHGAPPLPLEYWRADRFGADDRGLFSGADAIRSACRIAAVDAGLARESRGAARNGRVLVPAAELSDRVHAAALRIFFRQDYILDSAGGRRVGVRARANRETNAKASVRSSARFLGNRGVPRHIH